VEKPLEKHFLRADAMLVFAFTLVSGFNQATLLNCQMSTWHLVGLVKHWAWAESKKVWEKLR